MDGFILPIHYDLLQERTLSNSLRDINNPIKQSYEDNQSVRMEPLDCNVADDLSTEKYVDDALIFLCKHSWIYDFQLTHLLSGGTLQRIPPEWSTFLTTLSFSELNKLPSDPDLPAMPESLKDYVKTCHQLSLPRRISKLIQPVKLSNAITKGMNPKKRHEVSYMAAVVTEISQDTHCPLVVDVGAGLGYLSAVIANHPELQVLALECREMLTHGTEARGLDQGLRGNLDALTYNLQDDENSFRMLQNILREKLSNLQPCDNCDTLHIPKENSYPARTPLGIPQILKESSSGTGPFPKGQCPSGSYIDTHGPTFGSVNYDSRESSPNGTGNLQESSNPHRTSRYMLGSCERGSNKNSAKSEVLMWHTNKPGALQTTERLPTSPGTVSDFKGKFDVPECLQESKEPTLYSENIQGFKRPFNGQRSPESCKEDLHMKNPTHTPCSIKNQSSSKNEGATETTEGPQIVSLTNETHKNQSEYLKSIKTKKHSYDLEPSQINNVNSECIKSAVTYESCKHASSCEVATETLRRLEDHPNLGSNHKASVCEAAVCMIGLHCCGSLTPTMMKLFVSTPEIRSLVCVSCCFHSLQRTADGCSWQHFPMSKAVKSVLKTKLPGYEISVFGMRLAAQETRSRWTSQSEADHIFHSNNVGFRALLQLVCNQEKLSLEKGKRHIANKKDMASLDSYITAVLQRTSLGDECPDLGRKLHDAYTKKTEELKLIEPFTALQVALQPVLESLVLVDRILYLREAGFEAALMPIFEDFISPRNLAIIATKQ